MYVVYACFLYFFFWSASEYLPILMSLILGSTILITRLKYPLLYNSDLQVIIKRFRWYIRIVMYPFSVLLDHFFRPELEMFSPRGADKIFRKNLDKGFQCHGDREQGFTIPQLGTTQLYHSK